MTDNEPFFETEIVADLQLTDICRRAASGVWVRSRLSGHRFEALVFPHHATEASWELGDSRLAKLWLGREADREVVYHWDRGEDMPAADQTALAIVKFRAAGIAEHITGE